MLDARQRQQIRDEFAEAVDPFFARSRKDIYGSRFFPRL
jgi:hypothetical protein